MPKQIIVQINIECKNPTCDNNLTAVDYADNHGYEEVCEFHCSRLNTNGGGCGYCEDFEGEIRDPGEGNPLPYLFDETKKIFIPVKAEGGLVQR